jgi:preprotein translocase subunit SecA
MAGRGTDIRLGGPDQSEHDAVVALGGLYVIGTNRHLSRRVDLQLRGRSGRQGDPGRTRFFISLEDPLLALYGVRDLIPERRRPAAQDRPVEDPVVAREIASGQRIIEGTSFDIRRRLWRYSLLVDEQRRVLQGWRAEVLHHRDSLGLLAERSTARWQEVVTRFGPEEAARLERRLTLLAADRCWGDHLALVGRIRDCIPVVKFAGKDPLVEFTREVAAAFGQVRAQLDDEVVARFEALALDGDRIAWNQPGLLGPSSTWTYLVNDDPFGENPLRAFLSRPALAAATLNPLVALLLVLWTLALRWRARRKRVDNKSGPASG